jgi:hypothetical protein
MVNTNLYNNFFGVQTGGNSSKDLAALLFEKRDLLQMIQKRLVLKTI